MVRDHLQSPRGRTKIPQKDAINSDVISYVMISHVLLCKVYNLMSFIKNGNLCNNTNPDIHIFMTLEINLEYAELV